MLQVCLNGARSRTECPEVPVRPEELAAAAAEAVGAGAADVHLHPRNHEGEDTLEPVYVATAVAAVRALAPGVPVGVTTGAWAVPDARERAELVRSWTVLPDHASVNWHEEGAALVAEALLQRGVGVEAGLWSGTDAVERFRAWPGTGHVLRVLAEVTDTGRDTAAETAGRLLADIGDTVPRDRVLLHGEDGGAWEVLRLAAERGLATRIGLEDVLHGPDGTPAADNAELVRAARQITAERAA